MQQDLPVHLHLDNKSTKLFPLCLPALGYGAILKSDNGFQFMSPKVLAEKEAMTHENELAL